MARWAVARLSQNAILPGAQRNRTVYSVRVASRHSSRRIRRSAPVRSPDLAGAAGEAGTHEQGPLTGFRVHPHRGVVGDEVGLGDLAGTLAAFGGPRSELVPDVDAVGQLTELPGQTLIGGNEIGPRGVAAVRRQDIGTQDRRGRRIDERRHIGVPTVVVRRPLAAEVLVVAAAVDGKDLRKPAGGFSSCGCAGVTLPNRRANATCSAWPISWSRKKITL